MKDLKNLWWIWPLINSIAIIILVGVIDVQRQLINSKDVEISKNAQKIEMVKYRLEQPDSVVVINNIYIEKKKK